MIWSAFTSEHFMREADAVLAAEQQQQQRLGGNEDAASQQRDDCDEDDVFQPSLGNVAFGTAADGWAFRLDQFAEMYSAKLGAKPATLAVALWGDWAYLPKEKRVVRAKAKASNGRNLKTMFVQFALDPLWRAYSVCEGEDVQAVLGPIVSGRGLSHQVPARVLKGPDPRAAVKAVLHAWLPLSEAVLGMAVKHLPSPAAAAPMRLPHLLSGGSNTTLLGNQPTTSFTATPQSANGDNQSSAVPSGKDCIAQPEQHQCGCHTFCQVAATQLCLETSQPPHSQQRLNLQMVTINPQLFPVERIA
eukprot:GHRR01029027.1.p1 GENE.GHRR01029027.1~~GHRR01029027.1.p1  ORF type:complete len:303 (+),score=101.08 GHRR01029027.1:1-909(+)